MNGRIYRDRIAGCYTGGAAGDALGYAVEFDRLEGIRRKYGENGITEYSLDFGTGTAVVSDDTQMTLFTAEGIIDAIKAGVISPEDKKLVAYVHNSYNNWDITQGHKPGKKTLKDPPVSMLMDLPDLYKTRAPGITCLKALGSFKSRDLYKPINNSKGCGGIMRMAPPGLIYPDATLGEVVMMGAEMSAITHGHPLGCFPSGIFAAIVQQAVWCDETRSLSEMIERATDAARSLYGKSDYWDELEDLIDRAVSFAGNDRSDEANLKELGGGWVGDEALAVSLYCALRYENDFSTGLTASVNHDGDSDSTGAITGNILGALHGYESIEDKWKKNLQFHKLMLFFAEQSYLAQQFAKAYRLAKEAHRGQKDKGGKDYFEAHVRSVINGVDDLKEKTVAALHDIVEDTDVTLDELRDMDFDEDITEAVGVMTHPDHEPYFDYIGRVRENPLAAAVKRSDLRNNMDMSRIKHPTDADYRRLEKYKKAYKMLDE